MGNCICTSCCYAEQSPIAKIIDAQGNLRYIKAPITAAEIMLEKPGHLVSPVYDLRRNSRFTALRADEELLIGKLYMVIPAGKVGSKISNSDVEMIEFTCKRRRERQLSSKVPPAETAPAPTPAAEKEEEEGESKMIVLGGKDTGFTGYLSSSCRQYWKPALEPIYERPERS